MRIQKTILTFVIAVLLITGFSVSAYATDNCFSLGLVPTGFGIEYERKIFGPVTFYSEYGSLLEDFGYSLGINYYFQETPFQGFYAGLYQTVAHDEHGWENFRNAFREDMGFTPIPPSDYNLPVITLGYRKIFGPGFTVGALLFYGQAQNMVLQGARITTTYALRW